MVGECAPCYEISINNHFVKIGIDKAVRKRYSVRMSEDYLEHNPGPRIGGEGVVK